MYDAPKISPSILSADFMNMERDIVQVEAAGADFVHVDIMDGHFVPNLTIGVPFVKQLKRITNLPIDLHLMISNPLQQLPWFLECGPDMVSVHAEVLDEPTGEFDRAIDMIHKSGAKACLALKPDMRASIVKPYIHKLDMVLVMSVYPGFSGQKYIEGTEQKVARVVEIATEAGVSPWIEVDGGLGINEPTKAVVAAGADVLVAGNAVFGAVDRKAAIEGIRAVALDARCAYDALGKGSDRR